MFIYNKFEQDNYNVLSKIIYNNYGLVIIDSYIDTYMDDNFSNYPTSCILLLDKKWENKNKNDNISVYKQIELLKN